MQAVCNVKRVGYLPPTVFVPTPAVTAAIVRLEPLLRPRAPTTTPYDVFHDYLRDLWQSPGKMLLNAVRRIVRRRLGTDMERPVAETVLANAQVDGRLRPGQLSVEDFDAVIGALHAAVGEHEQSQNRDFTVASTLPQR